MKIANHQVVMREFPDEITLALNISGCPNNCIGCHSPYLRNDVGEEATRDYILELIKNNPGITCVGFMGGDDREEILKDLAMTISVNHPSLKIGWYSGRDSFKAEMVTYFDYIKFGHYDAECGPLNNKNTNQRLLACIRGKSPYSIKCELENVIIKDITHKFWVNAAK